MEIWKPVKGWENLYEVSNYGRIKRLCREGKYTKFNKSVRYVLPEKIYDYTNRNIRRDYILVQFKQGDLKYQEYLHRVVAEAFLYNDDMINKTQINHIDGNKHNNQVSNLEWVTPSYNTKHAYNTGLANNVRYMAQKTHGKIVQQYSLDGMLLNEYKSVREASKITGISKYGIYRNCIGIKTQYAMFVWKYKS